MSTFTLQSVVGQGSQLFGDDGKLLSTWDAKDTQKYIDSQVSMRMGPEDTLVESVVDKFTKTVKKPKAEVVVAE